MRLISFRVTKYRNILDSREIPLNPPLTCVVGRNQSGKTSLLKALHKFNPHEPEPYDIRRDWPRGDRRNRDGNQVVCAVRFELLDEERKDLGRITNVPVETDVVVVTRNYKGELDFHLDGTPDDFSTVPDSPQMQTITENLPSCATPASEGFVEESEACKEEARHLAIAGRVMELVKLKTIHQERLRRQLSPLSHQAQHRNEAIFLKEYLRQVNQLVDALKGEKSPRQRALAYLESRLPTFIYMDDYIQFKGTADLEEVAALRDQGKLSPSDKTFLMLLELAGLDLDSLVAKGRSANPDEIRERQLDLEDGARTLTNLVSARWGQNRYRIQFLADGQTFLTEIEEVASDMGMIDLEEQSNGFRWFFSFDLRFMHDSEGAFDGCVLLLDEPGIHLHPDGQKDLLRRLKAYAQANTLVYTTHLPYLVDLQEPSRIRAMILEGDGTATLSDDFTSGSKEDRLTLHAAMGTHLHAHCLLAERNLVVGSLAEYWIISALADLLDRKTGEGLPEDVRILPAGGTEEITYMAMMMGGQDLQVAALYGSDEEGRREESRLRDAWLPLYRHPRVQGYLLGDLAEVTGDFTVEDLFDEGYYMQLANECYAQELADIGVKKLDLANVSATGPIKDRACLAFDACNLFFDQKQVLALLRRDLRRTEKWDKTSGLKKSLAKKFLENIRKIFE